ncbi:MAG: M17 family metallopeptidase [Francisellaceae bacterium]
MSLNCFYHQQDNAAISVTVIPEKHYKDWLEKPENSMIKNMLNSSVNVAKTPEVLKLYDAKGHFNRAITMVNNTDLWMLSNLANGLPAGRYHLDDPFCIIEDEEPYLGFALASYRFNRYKSKPLQTAVRLYLPAQYHAVEKQAEAIYLTRDMINTPAADMGPDAIAKEAEKLAAKFGAAFHEIVGEALLAENYPGLYHVGKAAEKAPRLIYLSWGDEQAPKVTLVGKGVAFDTGGLDLKPSAGMLLMHKDMGGAANVLGLAQMIMSYKLPVRLKVVIPACENSVSGSSYHPSDVITMRNGKTVEITNTDAEGRVILADTLFELSQEKPDLLFDFATLTGAARVAVGTEIAACFSNDDDLADSLNNAAKEVQDPIWRMPLFSSYLKYLDSDVADIKNSSAVSYAGSITAALFLKQFINPDVSWAHFDIMAWNIADLPGRPKGGEAMGIRAVFELLQRRYH